MRSSERKSIKSNKNRKDISICDIIRYMTIRQDIAADKLGISVSTLKRRYYELDVGRWPVNSTYDNKWIYCTECTTHNKGDILHILNTRCNHAAEKVDTLTLKILSVAFTVGIDTL